ncbi:MAG TPA: NAD-dependent epimerase/dehydratase family protein [Blastocatellia bacterium]|nr:NAD-dependent epimerase/dehydratase family protein [Blastocatellia bacterium]
MSSLFITGATGFIGRSLVSTLDPAPYRSVYCLSRTGAIGSFPPESHVQVIKGDLRQPEDYAGALASCRTVVHLAAVTGKAPRAQYFEVNARGAEELIKQCERYGVENFLYVSTIAVKYQDKSRYYYAQSKEQGEDAVRRSRLRHLIVRPTIVIGPGGGPWSAISKLARGPFVALPGDGKARMQPIALEDIVACLRTILAKNLFTDQIIELGGPEKITCEQFLKRIHKRYRGKEPAVLRLPLKPLIAILSVMEKIFSNLAPVNAGQLSPFWQDSTAEPINCQWAPALAGFQTMSVDQQIERMVAYE